MKGLGLRLTSLNVSKSVSGTSYFNSRWGTRNIHKRKRLQYPIENGLGEFLPPAALKAVAVDYQDGLLQRLNEEVRGTPEENTSVAQTVINTAPYRERTLAFNYASLALNNSFFLDHLKPPPPSPSITHQAEISSHLANSLRIQHGSVAQLKSAFSAAVTGMFTNGWVWFVTDKNGNTGVIPTFGPGTLLIRSRSYMAHSKEMKLTDDLAQWDRGNPFVPPKSVEQEELPDDLGSSDTIPPCSPTAQPLPPNVNPSSPVSGISGANIPSSPNQRLPRFMHSSARSLFEIGNMMPASVYDGEPESRADPKTKTEMLNIGEVLHPLFCISVHEHAWMAAGYGVWGKEEWLKKFWTVLDWRKVSESYAKFYPDKSAF